MIPINDLQAKIYSNLKENLSVNVYDEPVKNPVFPFIVIGDYNLSTMEAKDTDYTFEWKLDIYTEYEGKKEVNAILSEMLDSISRLDSISIDGIYEIDSATLESANVSRVEGYYIANTNIKIEIV